MSREQILGRVRAALADVPRSTPEADVPVAWEYARPTPVDDLLGRFVERVEDYRAVVERCAPDDVGARVTAALQSHGVDTVVLPDGLDEGWRATIAGAGLSLLEDADLTAAQLNAVDAVVTGASVGVAETGTIVLDHGPDQGRRALSLVPDVHVCVVRADQVVSDVPEAVARLAGVARTGRPLTWISGPSATSDIELSRVEGVHGPRTLHVILAD
ncbi:lactate utilization protein C [Arsenicicoccus sp. MKL-02]|uniref:Lactate utilization protein C n=1 Tax=Arsenicicoccus cauae TaxID=2663847 RepID=A0A6I3IRC4_9MICO|nr:lactate utilization protein C [Arsenicicoccus cauae]MTB71219.1 lactate utilization protein C [Arsenicicoccus cauae]